MVLLSNAVVTSNEPVAANLKWRALPPLPDREGFAGMLAGVSGQTLLVAGGANFPDRRPWDGGAKRWYDVVWMLDNPDGSWRRVGQLPRPTAYGVSYSTPEGVLCAGGGDARSHVADVWLMVLREGRLQIESLPSLPQPCSFASGTKAGNVLYLSGGIDRPDATTCLRTFWALDLNRRERTWQKLEPCPGAERMLAVAGAQGDDFYLFSGTRLSAGADGKAVREYLRDAWRYRPGDGWLRLADLPRAVVAAPSPALQSSQGTLLVCSGDGGTHVDFKPETSHPGFSRDALAYDIRADRWTVAGPVPFSRATVPTVAWRDSFVIPSGEERPGYRSPAVWALQRSDP
ncbi:MAG TPA: hypothetical protein VHV77_16965 [Pirellulales bacterium]|nr:hypothetical protein [Pirellulales bacterium]